MCASLLHASFIIAITFFIDLESHDMLAAAQDFYSNLGTMAREKRYHNYFSTLDLILRGVV